MLSGEAHLLQVVDKLDVLLTDSDVAPGCLSCLLSTLVSQTARGQC